MADDENELSMLSTNEKQGPICWNFLLCCVIHVPYPTVVYVAGRGGYKGWSWVACGGGKVGMGYYFHTMVLMSRIDP